jgi:hypothetical protein
MILNHCFGNLIPRITNLFDQIAKMVVTLWGHDSQSLLCERDGNDTLEQHFEIAIGTDNR